jgi:hypothetical protein
VGAIDSKEEKTDAPNSDANVEGALRPATTFAARASRGSGRSGAKGEIPGSPLTAGMPPPC